MNLRSYSSPEQVGDRGLNPASIVLIVRPVVERGGYRLDRFAASLHGEVIVTSRQPLLDGARTLLRRGLAPETLLTIRHAGSEHDSFIPAPIGELAGWTIEETDRRGLRRRPWRPLPDSIRRPQLEEQGVIQPSGRGIRLDHILPGARRAIARPARVA